MSARVAKSIKLFERSDGLDTALYKNYLCFVERVIHKAPECSAGLRPLDAPTMTWLEELSIDIKMTGKRL